MEIVELQRNSRNWEKIVNEIVKMERKMFPKHESLAASFDEELKRKNSGLLYVQVEGEVVGLLLCLLPSLNLPESYRRKGLGEELMKSAMEKCRKRKIQRISLHVDPLRNPALSLYTKLGFKVDSLIEGYYSSNRNAYRMFLDFDPL